LFLAVSPKVKYVKVKCEEKTYIVAKERADDVFKGKEFSVEGEVTGKSLIGKKYLPLFPYYIEKYGDKAFKVVDGKDFVTTADGTGIVHIAPGFGEDDFNVGKKEGVPVLQHVGMDGKFTKEVTDFAGMDVKPKDDVSKADKEIAKWLKEHGLLFRMESYKHSYPHCWRCDSPLLNYATSSWFVAVESIKEKMLQVNADTQWVPGHIRDGRFGKWLEGARDWAISRNRYWGTPLPIWRCKETGELQVIGSRQEVMNQVPVRFTRVTVLRHGESEGNLIPIYQGKNPGTNLTANGKDQAASTGESLSTEKVTHIYYSSCAQSLRGFGGSD
jgi:isoleucyl-tRNA synthetase